MYLTTIALLCLTDLASVKEEKLIHSLVNGLFGIWYNMLELKWQTNLSWNNIAKLFLHICKHLYLMMLCTGMVCPPSDKLLNVTPVNAVTHAKDAKISFTANYINP